MSHFEKPYRFTLVIKQTARYFEHIGVQMKAIVLSLIAVSVLGCAGGGGDSPAAGASIVGHDYSGTYVINSVECFSATTGNLTTSASVSASTVVIDKNAQAVASGGGACLVAISGGIEFMQNGSYNLGTRTVTSATGGSCALTTTLSGSHTITPSSSTTTYSNGQIFGGGSGLYLRNPTTGNIGILSTYKNSADANDLCYTVMVKQ